MLTPAHTHPPPPADVASHEEGWLRLWDQHGKCTELGVAQFFSLITATFQQYNPNVRTAQFRAGGRAGAP